MLHLARECREEIAHMPISPIIDTNTNTNLITTTHTNSTLDTNTNTTNTRV